MNTKKRIEELERRVVELEQRVRDLEARPIYLPSTPVAPTMPWWPTPPVITFDRNSGR